MTSLPPCWWTKTKDHSSASFVRPPEVVHFFIVIGVSRGWLKTFYNKIITEFGFRLTRIIIRVSASAFGFLG